MRPRFGSAIADRTRNRNSRSKSLDASGGGGRQPARQTSPPPGTPSDLARLSAREVSVALAS